MQHALLLSIVFTILVTYFYSFYVDCQAHVLRFYDIESQDIIGMDQIQIKPGCVSCPRVYVPICADDNQTYINLCMMRCKNVYGRRPAEPHAEYVRNGPCQIFPS